MTMPRSTEELFDSAGGGAPLFFNKNSPVGATVSGAVVESAPHQVRDYEDSSLKFWDDGSPQMQLVVTLQTNLRDPSNPDDDGKRRVFIKWWGSEKANLVAAVQQAGDKFVRNGSILTVTFTGLGEQKDRRLNPPKMYAFHYEAPPTATEKMMTGAAAKAMREVQYSQGGVLPWRPEQQPALIEQAAQQAARYVAETPPQAAPGPSNGIPDRQAIIRQVRELAAEGLEASDIFEVIGGAFSQKAIAAMLNVKV